MTEFDTASTVILFCIFSYSGQTDKIHYVTAKKIHAYYLPVFQFKLTQVIHFNNLQTTMLDSVDTGSCKCVTKCKQKIEQREHKKQLKKKPQFRANANADKGFFFFQFP